MIALLALLEGPFGKLIMYGVAALFILASVFTGVAVWKHNIRIEALAKYNAAQLAQAQADNDRFREQLDAITKNGADIVDGLNKANAALAARDNTDWLDTEDAKKKDRASSEILKEAVRRISR